MFPFVGTDLNCQDDFMMYISDQSYTNPWFPDNGVRKYRQCASKTTATSTTECIFYCQGSASIKDVFIWVPPDAKLGASTQLTDVKINWTQ